MARLAAMETIDEDRAMGYSRERPLRVFTAFSGYDSQCLALKRLGIPYELVGFSETDKHAIQAHDALFPEWEGRCYGDISKIDWEEVPGFDLFTMSSPCQDFSAAGLQKGGVEGSGTRSSLLWECRKAILSKKPEYVLFENVKALVSAKFLPYFNKWQAELASYGYTNFVKVLNAKDYGVPQNRERVFMVSVLGGDAGYHFPKPFPLGKRLRDILEESVDESYFLSSKAVNGYLKRNEDNKKKGRGFKWCPKDAGGIASAVTCKAGSREVDNFVAEPIVCAMRGREAACLTAKRNEYGKEVRKAYESGLLKESRHTMQRLEPRTDGITNTITTVQKDNLIIEPSVCNIRKLTERECFRLMDVDDADIDKIQAAGISKTQQYKMAGNSIVVSCLCHIFRKLFIDGKDENAQLSLF